MADQRTRVQADSAPRGAEEARAVFGTFLERLPARARLALLSHGDADGLAAAAILARALRARGRDPSLHLTGKGESAWSAPVKERMAALGVEALLVLDLGSQAEPIVAEAATLIIDHHRPRGAPPGAALISGYGGDPAPTSGLLAYWAAGALVDPRDMAWMAAVSLLSDIGQRAAHALLPETKDYPGQVLRRATTLLNAPRRSSTGEARPALDLLLRARGPEEVIGGDAPEVRFLREAREEVAWEFNMAKRAAPCFQGRVALIAIHSACQVHSLVAQVWRTRLPAYIVLCANPGYRPGHVHFSARSSRQFNLLDFLRENAPQGADELYGHGHDQATGGALTAAAWNEFVARLGFGPEARVRLG